MNIIITCEKTLTAFRLKVLESLFESKKHKILACIVDDRSHKTSLQRLRKHIKKGRGGYVLVMAFKSLFGHEKHTVSTIEFLRTKNVPVIFTDSPYSEDTINKINGYSPDIMVLNGGFGIIKEPWLNLTKHGVISYHHGEITEYRGQPSAFWELYNGEKEIGVTVQKIGAGLDCGQPIVRKKIPIKCCDTLSSLKKRLYDQSIEMMRHALDLLEKDDFVPEKIESLGKLYTIPNLRQWLILNFRIAYRFICHKIKYRPK